MEGQGRARHRTRVRTVDGDQIRIKTDLLATEEPMEIRLVAGDEVRTIAVTMRTPGNDFELAAGYLFAEGVIAHRQEIAQIRTCADPEVDGEQRLNILTVDLRSKTMPDLPALDRHVMTSSACGVCGTTMMASLDERGYPPLADYQVTADLLRGLPDQLREQQGIFATTGGLHAAGLFSTSGKLIAIREDIGRHNAVDKLIGWALLEDRLPLFDCLVLVSGRGGYEIVQKTIAAGVPLLAAISAPSSLAVETARHFHQTLIGFLRAERFNIYSGAHRVVVQGEQAPTTNGAQSAASSGVSPRSRNTC